MEKNEDSDSEINNNIKINKKTFIKNRKGDVTRFYEVQKKIGEGAYGKIYKVRNKESGDMRAMKQIIKSKVQKSDSFERELNILSLVDHPNIVRLFEIFEDDKYFYLIMELCTGGDLLEKIKKRMRENKTFSEKEAAQIFYQLISAIAYCHEKGICHRDLKPENILFCTEDPNSKIKVIDFGFSIVREKNAKNNNMTSKVGTLYYISPEIIKGKYKEECDIWACGVILYVLLCGYYPFDGNSDKEIYQKISSINFEFPPSKPKGLSKQAKDLISSMICDASKRYNAKKILGNKWLCSNANASDITPAKYDFNISSLRDYEKFNRVKKLMLIFIASRLNIKESVSISNLFLSLDFNHDGELQREKFINYLLNDYALKNKELIDSEDANSIFDSINVSKSGKITYTEFLASYIAQEIFCKEEKLKEVFCTLAQETVNAITKNELFNYFELENNNENREIVDKLITINDYDQDGRIGFGDFKKMMENKK